MTNKQEPHEIFFVLRKKAKLTQGDFPGIVSRTTLSRYERGEQDISTKTLIKALRKINVSFGQFMSIVEAGQSTDYFTQNIPLYQWADLNKPHPESYNDIFYIKGASEKSFALRVRDSSMIGGETAYPIGSYLIVEPTTKRDKISNLSFVIAKSGGIHLFRQLVNGHLIAANPEFESLKDAFIVGTVSGCTWVI